MSRSAKIAIGTAAAGLLAATAVTVGRSKMGRTMAQKAKEAGRRIGQEASRMSRSLRKGDSMSSEMSSRQLQGRRSSAMGARRGARSGSSATMGRTGRGRGMRMDY
jgi:hypothetical protein